MLVTGLRIVVGETEFCRERSTGDLIEIDWTGGVAQRLEVGTETYNSVVTQIVMLLKPVTNPTNAGKMTDTDVKL